MFNKYSPHLMVPVRLSGARTLSLQRKSTACNAFSLHAASLWKSGGYSLGNPVLEEYMVVTWHMFLKVCTLIILDTECDFLYSSI